MYAINKPHATKTGIYNFFTPRAVGMTAKIKATLIPAIVLVSFLTTVALSEALWLRSDTWI